MDELLSIGRFSRLCGLTIGSLRHYHEIGLLEPADVDASNGFRRYSRSQLDDARAIATLRELERFDEDDRAWLRGRPSSPGRFNAGQKVNASLTAAFTFLFAVSGFLLWYGERDTRFRFASTILLHDGLMYLSLLLFVGHLYLALLRPATRQSLRGIATGYVRAEWARRRHPKWIAELEREERGDAVRDL
jgi:cytochrome b subunit of formate dehydrogenase